MPPWYMGQIKHFNKLESDLTRSESSCVDWKLLEPHSDLTIAHCLPTAAATSSLPLSRWCAIHLEWAHYVQWTLEIIQEEDYTAPDSETLWYVFFSSSY